MENWLLSFLHTSNLALPTRSFSIQHQVPCNTVDLTYTNVVLIGTPLSRGYRFFYVLLHGQCSDQSRNRLSCQGRLKISTFDLDVVSFCYGV